MRTLRAECFRLHYEHIYQKLGYSQLLTERDLLSVNYETIKMFNWLLIRSNNNHIFINTLTMVLYSTITKNWTDFCCSLKFKYHYCLRFMYITWFKTLRILIKAVKNLFEECESSLLVLLFLVPVPCWLV